MKQLFEFSLLVLTCIVVVILNSKLGVTNYSTVRKKFVFVALLFLVGIFAAGVYVNLPHRLQETDPKVSLI
jgi:hypothetical protein